MQEHRFIFSEPKPFIAYRHFDRLVADISGLMKSQSPADMLRLTLCLVANNGQITIAGFAGFLKLAEHHNIGVHLQLPAVVDAYNLRGIPEHDHNITFTVLGIEVLSGSAEKIIELVTAQKGKMSFMNFSSDITQQTMSPDSFKHWLKYDVSNLALTDATLRPAQVDVDELSLPQLARSVLDIFDTYS
ncbi:hypothetical protein [Vibrio metschnikovii]|uniref:hypothetical protein n=1 Tax=Vibrio metschnikovii TaxID=28172 RepID=UPI001C2F380C|nr:hypothetical protein [Vibrio metschnikovii]